MKKLKMGKNDDIYYDESLPYILGTGQAWGNVCGKVKTIQVGFVRRASKTKIRQTKAEIRRTPEKPIKRG